LLTDRPRQTGSGHFVHPIRQPRADERLALVPEHDPCEDESVKHRRKKLFRLSQGDLGDIARIAIRPHDACFDLEQSYWNANDTDVDTYTLLRGRVGDVRIHDEPQDTSCEAWTRLLALVEAAAESERSVFWPASELDPDDMTQIVELPRSIAKLKSVTHLRLYGSHLVRIPPEIGEMTSLENLDVYTSRRLHWFPYEITKCKNLRDSRVSTRSLYGNFKYRPPFPPLSADLPESSQADRCGVCAHPLAQGDIHLVWVSLLVATDVLPLLVQACSLDCIARLPAPAKGYTPHPHDGGLSLGQPPRYFSGIPRT